MLHLKKFKKIVKTDGPWDFKSNLRQMNKNDESVCPKCKEAVTLCGMCIQFEAISNIHYGYVALKAGIFEELAIYAAGIAQLIDSKKYKEALKAVFRPDLNGDEVEDQVAIRIGFEYYKSGNLCELVRRNASDLKTVDASCNPQKEAGILPYIEPVIVW
jgi:hypothetical protein